MARKILVLTVGGACEPIITSIKNHNPDFIYFVCSSDNSENGKGSYLSIIGEGNVCRDKSNIVMQLSLQSNQYELVKLDIDAEDDLDKTFEYLKSFLNELNKKNPNDEIIVDYTGGTKTMSAALVLSSVLIENISISLVSGLRRDLVKVINHTETATLINTKNIIVDNQLNLFNQLINNYDFAAAQNIIEKLIQSVKDRNIHKKLQRLRNITQIFDLWDKFDHIGAFELLNLYTKEPKYFEYLLPLKAIISERKLIDSKFNIPESIKIDNKLNKDFILVVDLLLNAERKAKQGRYDDAVGRIYRACELFAQLYLLKKFQLSTGNLEVEKLPEHLRKSFEDKRDKSNKVRIGLMDSYNLIHELGDQTVGSKFYKNQKKFLSSLEIRNSSILAHGFTPITNEEFGEINDNLVLVIKSFIETVSQNSNIILNQFVNEIIP